MNEEILKLAKEVGGRISVTAGNQDRLHSFSDDGLEAFYCAAFNAGRASQVTISIPTPTMEQEFQTHYRRGFNAGIDAAEKVCKAEKFEVIEDDSCDHYNFAIMHCIEAIRALEMKP